MCLWHHSHYCQSFSGLGKTVSFSCQTCDERTAAASMIWSRGRFILVLQKFRPTQFNWIKKESTSNKAINHTSNGSECKFLSEFTAFLYVNKYTATQNTKLWKKKFFKIKDTDRYSLNTTLYSMDPASWGPESIILSMAFFSAGEQIWETHLHRVTKAKPSFSCFFPRVGRKKKTKKNCWKLGRCLFLASAACGTGTRRMNSCILEGNVHEF